MIGSRVARRDRTRIRARGVWNRRRLQWRWNRRLHVWRQVAWHARRGRKERLEKAKRATAFWIFRIQRAQCSRFGDREWIKFGCRRRRRGRIGIRRKWRWARRWMNRWVSQRASIISAQKTFFHKCRLEWWRLKQQAISTLTSSQPFLSLKQPARLLFHPHHRFELVFLILIQNTFPPQRIYHILHKHPLLSSWSFLIDAMEQPTKIWKNDPSFSSHPHKHTNQQDTQSIPLFA